MSVECLILAYKNMEQAVELSHVLQRSTGFSGALYHVHDNTEKNENIHVLWNRWLAWCTADYFMVLNPDTKPVVGWLSKMLRTMEKNSRIVAVGPSTNNCYNEQSNRVPDVVGWADDSWVPQVLIPGFCALYNVEALRDIGGWREDFDFYGGDLDLALRLQLRGHLTAWSVSAFVWHEWGGSAKKLGDEKYAQLRMRGNEQLQAAINQYQGRFGQWKALSGGGVSYAEDGTVSVKGQEDAGGGGSEREATVQEAAGTLRDNRLGEDPQESQEKEGLT